MQGFGLYYFQIHQLETRNLKMVEEKIYLKAEGGKGEKKPRKTQFFFYANVNLPLTKTISYMTAKHISPK